MVQTYVKKKNCLSSKVRDHANMVRAHYTTYISTAATSLSFGRVPFF